MNNKEVLFKILDDLKELDRCIHENHHMRAVEAGITVEQYHLLLHLARINTCKGRKMPTIGQLAEKFNNAQNTMSEKISRLQKKEFIKRVRDDKDRRITRISLSDKGSNLLENIHSKAEEKALLNALSSMNEETINRFSTELKEIISNLKKQV